MILGFILGCIIGAVITHLAHEYMDSMLPRDDEKEKLWFRYKDKDEEK